MTQRPFFHYILMYLVIPQEYSTQSHPDYSTIFYNNFQQYSFYWISYIPATSVMALPLSLSELLSLYHSTKLTWSFILHFWHRECLARHLLCSWYFPPYYVKLPTLYFPPLICLWKRSIFLAVTFSAEITALSSFCCVVKLLFFYWLWLSSTDYCRFHCLDSNWSFSDWFLSNLPTTNWVSYQIFWKNTILCCGGKVCYKVFYCLSFYLLPWVEKEPKTKTV